MKNNYKKKVGKISLIITFLYLAILIGFIALIVSLLSSNQPSFTIYENECPNKIFFNFSSSEKVECYCAKNTTSPCLAVCYKLENFSEINKQVCTQKEVSRRDIENKKLNETDTIIADLFMLAFLDIKTEDKLILLDKNCRCELFVGHTGKYNINWTREEMNERNITDGSLLKNNFVCSKYSCFDKYIVEVKN